MRSPLANTLATLAIAGSLLGAGVAEATRPGGARLSAVGPIDPANGYPLWYLDHLGVRLELCLDFQNPGCGFVGNEIPRPLDPVVFPSNFPEEAFYQRVDSIMDTSAGGTALLVMALEAAFANGGPAPGDQIVFGRVRIWVDNLPLGVYTVTHPYGFDVFDVTELGRRNIRSTEDFGIGTPGDFSLALTSSVAPFLVAVAPAPPEGFVGDAATPATVNSSVFGTNLFRIEGPAGAFAPDNAYLCADPTLGDDSVLTTDCIETDQFIVMGRHARTAGVSAVRVSYDQAATGGGVLDVFARTFPGQVVRVEGAGVAQTLLRGDGQGSYFARLRYTGPRPSTLSLTNTTDEPDSVVTATVTDRVLISRAEYDALARTLTIQADSSDDLTPQVLSANGLGDLDAAGLLVLVGVDAPPSEVTVVSTAGGADTTLVVSTAGDFNVDPVVANAGLDQTVPAGVSVTLSAGASSGTITGYLWQQTAGTAVTLSDPASASPSFTAPVGPPAVNLTLTFDVTVAGPAGTSVDSVTVTVLPPDPPVANAGPDRTNVTVGLLVPLDGTATVGAATVLWTQVSGPLATLNNPTSRTASFNFPLPVYPANQTTVTFQLTATSLGGSATDTVSFTNVIDTLSVSRAEFRTTTNAWRVDGLTTILGAPAGPGDTVTIRLASTCTAQTVIGSATSDDVGGWSFKFAAAPAAQRPGACRRLDLGSNRVGVLRQVVLTVRN